LISLMRLLSQSETISFIVNSMKRVEDELKPIVDAFRLETSKKLKEIEEKTRSASISYFANKIEQVREKIREYEKIVRKVLSLKN